MTPIDTLILNQVYNTYVILKAATAVISRTTPGTYDPVSGSNTGTVTTPYTTLCKLDSSSIKTLGFKFGDGLVQLGMIEISVPAKGLPIMPLAGDRITAGGIPYEIISNRPSFAPGGTMVEHVLLVKQ